MRSLLADVRALFEGWSWIEWAMLALAYVWFLSMVTGLIATRNYHAYPNSDPYRMVGYYGNWSPNNPTAE